MCTSLAGNKTRQRVEANYILSEFWIITGFHCNLTLKTPTNKEKLLRRTENFIQVMGISNQPLPTLKNYRPS